MDMKAAAVAVSLLLAALPAAPRAEADGQAADALLGNWSAACDAWGTAAICRLYWEQGLHPDHLLVHYSIEAEADGLAIFRGRGLYRRRGQGFDGYWEDSNGSLLPLRARFVDGVMTTHWGDGTAGEEGRSEYRLDEDGRLHATDSVRGDDGWRVFMTASYDRDG